MPVSFIKILSNRGFVFLFCLALLAPVQADAADRAGDTGARAELNTVVAQAVGEEDKAGTAENPAKEVAEPDELQEAAESPEEPEKPAGESPNAAVTRPEGNNEQPADKQALADAAEQPLEQADSTEALIDLLRKKGLLSDQEAANLISRVEEEEKREQQEKIVHIEKIKRDVKGEVRREVNPNRLRNQIKNEMVQEMNKRSASLGPSWAQRIRFGGDIRLRYQRTNRYDDNALQRAVTGEPVLLNTTEDRTRYRVRVRLKATAEVNPDTTAGIRITTGNERDPVSTNETLGDYSNKDSIVLDQAYLRYKLLPEITLWGGRIPNPYFTTSLVFDSDLALEGGAVQMEFPLHDQLIFFGNVGAYMLEEFELQDDDKYMYGFQGGMIVKPWRKDLTLKTALAFYDFQNMQGQPYFDSTPIDSREIGRAHV